MKKVIAVALVAVGMIFGANGVSAQSPENQFGVGGYVGAISAAQLQYAFTPAFHLGTGIGLELRGGGSSLVFAPYGKFIFAGSKELKPFLMATFLIASYGTGVEGTTSQTSTALNLGGGVEHFITPNMGVWVGVTVVNLPLSPSGSDVGFGILMPTLGAEWFL